MGREGMFDDSGYRGFEECSSRETCCVEAYQQGRADERAKVIEILNQCSCEMPYENSAFGYGIKIVDYSKAMNMLKEQKNV